MKVFVFCICSLLFLQNSLAGNYLFSTSSGTITDLTIPWTKQGDTLRYKITIKNTSGASHSVKLSLSRKPGIEEKSSNPLFFEFGDLFHDTVRVELAAGQGKEFTLVDIPATHVAGHFRRYINVYEDLAFQPVDTFEVIGGSALTLRKRGFKPEILVELRDLAPNVPEYFPIYFHNDSAGTQVLTEFLGTTLPPWITVQNKFKYPLVVVSGEIVNFANIIISPPAPNMEKLEGPVYLIYQNGSDTSLTGVRLYITSVTDTALLKPCVEFSVDGAFGPVKVGESVSKPLQIKSNRPYPVTLTQPMLSWGDVEGFSFVTSSFPITLPAFSSTTVSVTFAPATVDPFIKYRYAAGFTVHAEADSSSCDPVIALAGIATINGGVVADNADPVVVTIMPNPASNVALISVAGLERPEIRIVDVLGNSKSSLAGSELRAEGLAAGTYLIRCSGEDSNGRRKVVTRVLTVSR